MIYVLAVIVIALVVLAIVFGQKGMPGGELGYPYVPAKQLFSAAERSFLLALDQAVGDEYRVFGKVRVGDVAQPRSGLSKTARQGALNRIAYKHFDFVVCRRDDMAIACVVELNDASHASQRAQRRDELVAKVCSAIKLPLLTVPAKGGYEVGQLRRQFREAIGLDRAGGPTPDS